MAEVRDWITESFKRFFQNGWILQKRIKWLFLWMAQWISDSETTRIRIRTQKLNKNSTLARVILLNCQEHFLLAYLEISKLAACILKHNIINEYIYIYIYIMIRTKCKAAMLMNGTAFVIAKMLPETNYYTCSRSGQMNKTAIILSCKILWCWISDAWSAVF